ncbi:MAG: hypothetical protein IJW29_05185 [Clostridia bacterium]|nr:hypothetical protein [Clostridia bacterium]
MKKTLSLLLALCMMLSCVLLLSACDEKDDGGKGNDGGGGDEQTYTRAQLMDFSYLAPDGWEKADYSGNDMVDYTRTSGMNFDMLFLSTAEPETGLESKPVLDEWDGEDPAAAFREQLEAQLGADAVKAVEVLSISDSDVAIYCQISVSGITQHQYTYIKYATLAVENGDSVTYACWRIHMQYATTGGRNDKVFGELKAGIVLNPQN